MLRSESTQDNINSNIQWLFRIVPTLITSGDSELTAAQQNILTEITKFIAETYGEKDRRFEHIPEIYLHDFVVNLKALLRNSLSTPFDDASISDLKKQSEQLL